MIVRTLLPVSVIGAALLFIVSSVSAAEPTGVTLQGPLPLAQAFTFLLLMLGPFKIIGPFLKATEGADVRLLRQIALRATLYAALALLIAAFLGETFLSKYGIPLEILVLASGIIFFLVALRHTLEQFEAPVPPEPRLQHAAPSLKLALSPLAFPAIVTPYGIAALVVLLSLDQSHQSRLSIGAIVAAILALDLIAMLAARQLRSVLGFVLTILGAVLGVIQVALGLRIIDNALRALGVL